MVPLGGNPFGVVTSSDGRWSFVAQLSGRSVSVVSDRGARPQVVRQIDVGVALEGAALSHDGRYLLVAAGSGAVVIDVRAALRGSARPLLGELSAGSASSIRLASAIEVALSPNDRFAFVSLESADEVAVFDLRRALRRRFRGSSLVGTIPLGLAPVGMAVSPDGRWLYATSEQRNVYERVGTLSVIDLRKAETQPRRSVIATVAAGCDPVRVAVSPSGETVWVTARESNSLLAFSAARLRADPKHALLAHVRVGSAPVPLAVVDGGRRIVVGDSNRFHGAGQHSALTLVSAIAALRHKPAVLGEIRAGSFPREMSVDLKRKRLLVTNFGSNEIEVVDTASLP